MRCASGRDRASFRLLTDLENAPALPLGDGARLGDADEVAHAALVLLVVDLEAGPLLDGLLVEPVRLGRADLDDDRLVHLVRDHSAQPDLALAALGGVCDLVHDSCSDFALRPRFGLAAGSGSVAGSA